jgi:CRP-like cAMP-binding protein/preprotein translocase subunit SecF
MARTIGIAILLTFLTTYFGFVSIYTNEIRLLQEFGLVASTGLAFNFLITSLTVPAMLKIMSPHKVKAADKNSSKNLYQKAALFIFTLVMNYSKTTVALLVLIVMGSVYGALQMNVNNNPLGYFKPDTQVVSNFNRLGNTLSGTQTFSVILHTGIEDTFKKVRYLEEIEKIQDYLKQSKDFDKSLSFNDFLKIVHLAMEDDEVDNIEDLYLPDSDELVRDYTNFIKHELFESYVTKDFSSARILVRHSIHDSSDLRQAIQRLEQFIHTDIDPALKADITGASIVQSNGADYMASGQAKSLILISLVIVAVVAVLFVNWKAGLVALIPNMVPIVILFGVMGFFDISLDTGTAMVAVIALGICVDDTVHFMTRYHHNTRNRNDPDAALKDTILDESVPIITTSLALMAGFASLTLSSFIPIENFGLLSALVMLLSLLTTFVITPLLLTNISLVTMWDMLSLKLQAQVVDDCPLFKGLSPWQIKQAILSSQIKFFQAGDIVVSQGSIGNEMYVILKGHVTVKMDLKDGTVATVNEIPEGGLFGEIALISQIPRVATVIATEKTRLLALRWDSIKRFARFHPQIAATLFKNLASIAGNRLAKTDGLTVLRDEYTGAANQDFFKELMELEALKSQRHKEPLTFICFTLLVSLDYKEFNELLRRLSIKVKDGTRKIDVYARWRNRRFVILLSRTQYADAEIVADRIRRNVMDILSCLQPTGECMKMTLWTYDGLEPIETLIDKTESILNSPMPEPVITRDTIS